MDSRSLRELGLLEVTRLFGIEALPEPAGSAASGLRAVRAEGGQWLFVAAGVGDDDPFAGTAARLLDGMLTAVGCRRGGEVRALEAQLEGNPPKLILAFGAAAASTLLGAEADLQALRGKVHRFRDIAVVVTLDPVQLLRAPAEKARAWEDLVLARRTVAGA